MSLNGQRYRFYTPFRRRQITNASYQTIDDSQVLRVKLLEDSLSANLVSLYEFDENRFNDLVASKQDQLFEVSLFSQNYIEGTITTIQDEGYLLFTIPFDSQWEITVNGKNVEPEAVLNDTLMAIPITAGEHNISLKYFPRSIWFGLASSITGLMLFIGSEFYISRQKKKND